LQKLVIPLTGTSEAILSAWDFGPVDFAFIDGDHRAQTVARELRLLPGLLASNGTVVLDDYHMGVLVRWIPLAPLSWLLGKSLGALRRLCIPVPSSFPSFPDLALTVLLHRLSGVKRATEAYHREHDGHCSLEIVPMPSRGSYQGNDYALAVWFFPGACEALKVEGKETELEA
jgi:hypothetical protein